MSRFFALKGAVFWVVTRCSLADNVSFQSSLLPPNTILLKMEAASSSEHQYLPNYTA